MATLPTFTKTVDTAFTETWYEIRPQAIDNVLLATVVWALLKMKGCFTEQRGSYEIERTVRYQLPTPVEVAKGDVLGDGEWESRTAAFWTFRFLSQHIQRDAFTDRANAGKFQIRSYVTERLQDATDALAQRYETDLLRAIVTDESGKNIQGLNDLLPPFASRSTGTYGRIARPATYTADTAGVVSRPATGNTFWGPNYMAWRTPIEVNLIDDMQHFYNSITNNQENPDIILTTQTLYEMYGSFGLDAIQVMADQRMLNLGFNTLMYMGSTLTWSPNVASGTMQFLNSKYIEAVYDPGMWFEMTEWKAIPKQTERLAHILCAMNIIGAQPRRHGLAYTA